MQRGEAWAPVAGEVCRERYPSVCLDYAEPTLRGPARGDRRGGDRRRASSATRWAAASRCTPRCATRGRSGRWSWSARRRDRGRGGAATRRAPTRRSPPGWRRSRSTRSWSVWERQPVFADPARRARRLRSAPGRLSHDPRQLADAAAHRRAGRARAGLGSRSATDAARCCAIAGRARRPLRRAPRGGWPSVLPRGARAAIVPERRARAAARAPERGRGATAPSSSTSTSASAASSTRDAEPRALGHREQPVARARAAPARSRASNSSSVASPQASDTRSDGRELQRRGDAPRAVERARQERRPRPCSRASRSASRAALKPPLRGELDVDDVARRRSPRRRARRRRRRPTRRRRSAPAPRARTLGQLVQRRARLLDELEVVGGERPSAATASSTDQAPFASIRSAGHGPIASRTARDALDVVGQADLQLEAREAVAHAVGRALGRPRRAARRAACG